MFGYLAVPVSQAVPVDQGVRGPQQQMSQTVLINRDTQKHITVGEAGPSVRLMMAMFPLKQESAITYLNEGREDSLGLPPNP